MNEKRYAEVYFLVENIISSFDITEDEAHTLLEETQEAMMEAMNVVGESILVEAVNDYLANESEEEEEDDE